MQRLSGLDAMFLSMETPTNHMHVTGVFVLDPSEAPQGFSFDQVRDMVGRRLNRAPPFRRRLVEVPFKLANPMWIEDPNFDLDYHVRRACLPSPGGQGELEAFVGQMIGLPLDRKRPLWEMYLVEGLEGGRQAIVMKMHHSAIDGVSGAELTAAWLDLEADPPADADDDNWHAERVPTDIDLLIGAWTQLASSPVKAVRAARRIVETALHVSEHNRDSGVMPPPSPFSAPKTSFNQAITPHRRVAFADVALDDLKAVKNHFGCTVNDVILALCASALRRYLLAAGEDELPEEPLVGFVPMSVRTDDERLSAGNRISAMLTSLATDIADPVERLRTISAGMADAKSQESRIGAEVLTDWTEFTFPALIGRAARAHLVDAGLRSGAAGVQCHDLEYPGTSVSFVPCRSAHGRDVPARACGRGCRAQHHRDELLRRRVLRADRMPGDGPRPRRSSGDDHSGPRRASGDRSGREDGRGGDVRWAACRCRRRRRRWERPWPGELHAGRPRGAGRAESRGSHGRTRLSRSGAPCRSSAARARADGSGPGQCSKTFQTCLR